MMKTFKKYLKFLFVLPLFILSLFVNLTISADEIVVADNTVNTVNTGSLLSYDFEGTNLTNATYTNTFRSVIESSTFNTQNYSYKNYYNNNLSFNNYNGWKDFPKILNNFYLKINCSLNIQGSTITDLIVPCEISFNDNTYNSASIIDINNQLITKTATKSVHIVSSIFKFLDSQSKNAFLDIWLFYDDDNGIGNIYLGSRIDMISDRQQSVYVNELHFELFNDLSTFNTYLDTISPSSDDEPEVCVPDFNASLFNDYAIFSSDNIPLDNGILQDSDFNSTNSIKPGFIHYVLDNGNGEESGSKIIFPLKTISSSSGYIFELQNGNEPIKCLFELYGLGGSVLYSRQINYTSSIFKFDSSELGTGIIIDAIGITFTDTELQNSPNFSLKIVNNAIINAEQNGYNNGYSNGLIDGESIGYDNGYNVGFINGKNEGLESQFNLGTTLLKIADIPINILSSILSFDILGINVFGLFTGITTVIILVWVVKKFLV